MTLRSFCTAVYKRNGKVTSQTKFLQALFSACGTSYQVSDDYGPKLFKREAPLDPDIRSMFPKPIDREALRNFLQDHITPEPGQRKDVHDRIREIAEKTGLGGRGQIDQGEFFWALTDWLNSIIHTPENTERLLDHYLRRVNEGVPDDGAIYQPPTHPGDKVDVLYPPTQQDYRPAFWGKFEHRWVMKNLGHEPWVGRTLVCTNPNDNGIRPPAAVIPVPNSAPSERNLIEIRAQFTARGREGDAISEWQMHDESGMNCFPGSSNQFNVEATVVNPNVSSNGGRR